MLPPSSRSGGVRLAQPATVSPGALPAMGELLGAAEPELFGVAVPH